MSEPDVKIAEADAVEDEDLVLSRAQSLRNRKLPTGDSKIEKVIAEARKLERPVGYNSFSDDGEAFVIPPSTSTVSLFYPRNFALISALLLLMILPRVGSVLFGWWSASVHMCIFLFFRACYNVGIGIGLSRQSRSQWFTGLVDRLLKSESRLARFVIRSCWKAGVRREFHDRFDSMPVEFVAWVCWKAVVNLILINDGVEFVLFALKCFNAPTSYWDLLVILQYVVGVVLIRFNYWAKVDAHRCVGAYAWYWGDFFFKKDADLTFDGIFDLFPHPMYTVGYAAYYGLCLLMRSYTLLFVALVAHGAQLAFLCLVEEPHIEKIYGTNDKQGDKEAMDSLFHPRKGWFPQNRDAVLWKDLDLTRVGDAALLLITVYTAWGLWAWTVPGLIIHFVVWRAVHWGGLGSLLYLQSRFDYFVRCFTVRGRTAYEAFSNWKQLYNLSYSINLLTFSCAAIRLHGLESWEHATRPSSLAAMLVGFCLIALTYWSHRSSYDAVGAFGFFYADFFIQQDAFRSSLVYTGIYRFLNNPELVTHYAGLYGTALATQSWTVLYMAGFSHLCNYLFLIFVERPHMQRLYDRTDIRHHGPLAKKVKQMAQARTPATLRAKVKKIKNRALSEIYNTYAEFVKDDTSHVCEDKDGCTLEAPQSLELGSELTVVVSAPTSHSDGDWVGVYPYGTLSAPGSSDGRWLTMSAAEPVEAKMDGGCQQYQLTFPPSLLPERDGLYEIRYHREGSYDVTAQTAMIMQSS